MTNEYRDPLAGIRSQLVYKRGAIDALLTELTPVRRLVLNPEVIADIDRQHASLKKDGTDIAALSECLRLGDALEDLLARAVERSKEQAKLPEQLRPLGPPPWQLRLPFHRLDMTRVATSLVARWGATSARKWGNAGAVELAVDGHPLLAIARGMIVNGLFRPKTIAVDIALMTSIPLALPDFGAYVEAGGDRTLKTLGISRSRKTGDVAFDETYFLNADEPTTKALLGDNVRRALLEMARHDPRVSVGGGLAEIGWSMRMNYDAIAQIPEAAVRFIVALRETIAKG